MKDNKQNIIMAIVAAMGKIIIMACKATWEIIKLGIGIR